jgi:ParB family chromosome partitioning protein
MGKKLEKPRLKSVDELFGLGEELPAGRIITFVHIDTLVPFENHPFRLYTGERLDDMVESIRNHGVIMPLLVRKKPKDAEKLEILAGHNRRNSAKLAGCTEVPVILLEGITDEEALAYVVETNLMQRSFSDMSHSEKAAVIALQHSKMFSQGKRNDILEHLRTLESPDADSTFSQIDKKSTTHDRLSEEYNLSRATIARYLRINQLCKQLKLLLDDGALAFIPAVEVSFLTEQQQWWVADNLDDGFSIDLKKAALLRQYSKEGRLDRDTITLILSGEGVPSVSFLLFMTATQKHG